MRDFHELKAARAHEKKQQDLERRAMRAAAKEKRRS
jgi:hypothetical protein